MAQSWTPADLSAKNSLWGKFVAESFNSADLSLVFTNYGDFAVSPLLCHVMKSKHKALIIKDTFTHYYTKREGNACHHHLFAAAMTVPLFTLTYKQPMCNEPEDDSPACGCSVDSPQPLKSV